MKYVATQDKLDDLYKTMEQYELYAADHGDPNHHYYEERALLFQQKITIVEFLLFGADKGLAEDDMTIESDYHA